MQIVQDSSRLPEHLGLVHAKDRSPSMERLERPGIEPAWKGISRPNQEVPIVSAVQAQWNPVGREPYEEASAGGIDV